MFDRCLNKISLSYINLSLEGIGISKSCCLPVDLCIFAVVFPVWVVPVLGKQPAGHLVIDGSVCRRSGKGIGLITDKSGDSAR